MRRGRSPARAALFALLALLVAWPTATVAKGIPTGPDCEWLAGDLHVHTTYSHDSYGGPTDDNTGPEQAHTWGWSVGEQGTIAQRRGLDFVAITDHNDLRSIKDKAFGTLEPLDWIPGYENSLKGHAQMLGATKLLKNGKGSASDVGRLVRELHALGGVFQINHPSDGEWIGAYGKAIVPDAIEVWNIGPWYFQPPFPAANDNDQALAWYDSWLDRGFHVTATGGSDNHWRSVTPVAGVGQPTTWVCARKRAPPSILEGIRRGRTFIAREPPTVERPLLMLGVDADRDFVFERMMGDTVPAESGLDLYVWGRDGARVRLVADGTKTIAEYSGAGWYEVGIPKGASWIRAEMYMEDAPQYRSMIQPLCDVLEDITSLLGQDEVTYCRNRLVMVALTSPIYVEH